MEKDVELEDREEIRGNECKWLRSPKLGELDGDGNCIDLESKDAELVG